VAALSLLEQLGATWTDATRLETDDIHSQTWPLA
jgi:hypothetical protein